MNRLVLLLTALSLLGAPFAPWAQGRATIGIDRIEFRGMDSNAALGTLL